jgi:hypothetical protein
VLRHLMCSVVVGVLLTGACGAGAQEPGPPPPDGLEAPPFTAMQPRLNVDKELARLSRRYTLSNDQKAQVREILLDEKRKMDALFADSSIGPEQSFAKIKAIREDEISRIAAILTPDQRSKYEKDTKNRQPFSDEPPPGPPPSGEDSPGPPPGEDSGGGPLVPQGN